MQHLFTLLGNYSVGLDLSLDEKGGLTRRLKTTPRWDKRLSDQPHAVGFAQACRRADIAIAMHARKGRKGRDVCHAYVRSLRKK